MSVTKIESLKSSSSPVLRPPRLRRQNNFQTLIAEAVDLAPQDVRFDPPLFWVFGRPAVVYWRDIMIYSHQRAEIFIHLHKFPSGRSGEWLARRGNISVGSVRNYVARMRIVLREVNAPFWISHGRNVYVLERNSGC